MPLTCALNGIIYSGYDICIHQILDILARYCNSFNYIVSELIRRNRDTVCNSIWSLYYWQPFVQLSYQILYKSSVRLVSVFIPFNVTLPKRTTFHLTPAAESLTKSSRFFSVLFVSCRLDHFRCFNCCHCLVGYLDCWDCIWNFLCCSFVIRPISGQSSLTPPFENIRKSDVLSRYWKGAFVWNGSFSVL